MEKSGDGHTLTRKEVHFLQEGNNQHSKVNRTERR
jgi:hypothetical protein